MLIYIQDLHPLLCLLQILQRLLHLLGHTLLSYLSEHLISLYQRL